MDGRWGAWGPWSSDCPTNCLRERKRWRIRRRTCTNPAPQGDGNDCRGDKIEQDICGKNIKYFLKFASWLQYCFCTSQTRKFYLFRCCNFVTYNFISSTRYNHQDFKKIYIYTVKYFLQYIQKNYTTFYNTIKNACFPWMPCILITDYLKKILLAARFKWV